MSRGAASPELAPPARRRRRPASRRSPRSAPSRRAAATRVRVRPPPDLLRDEEVPLPGGRDLRQVGHDEDLLAAREGPELPSHRLGRRARDAGVHLVEDEGPHRTAAPRPAAAEPDLFLRQRRREGELDARELAPRGDLRERPRRLARVRGEREGDDVDAVGRTGHALASRREGALGVGPTRHRDVEGGLREREVRRGGTGPLSQAGGPRPRARRKAPEPPSGRRRTLHARPSRPSRRPLRDRKARRVPSRSPRESGGRPSASRRTSSSGAPGRRAARPRRRGATGPPPAARGRGTPAAPPGRASRWPRRSRRRAPRRTGRFPRAPEGRAALPRPRGWRRSPRTRAPPTTVARRLPTFSTFASLPFSEESPSSSPSSGFTASISRIWKSRSSSFRARSASAARRRERSVSRARQVRKSPAVRADILREARVPVEQLARRRRVEKLARLGLPVEDEEARGDLGERLQDRGRAVHEEAPLSPRGHLAPDDDAVGLPSSPSARPASESASRTASSSESKAPSTTSFSAPARTSVASPRSPERSERASTTSDFPAPVSPGQDGQPLPERDLHVLEDGEVADAEGREQPGQARRRAVRRPRLRPSRPSFSQRSVKATPNAVAPGGVARRTRARSSPSARCRGAPTASSGRRTPSGTSRR